MSFARRPFQFIAALAALFCLAAVLLAEGALHVPERPRADAHAADYWAAQMGATWRPVTVRAKDGIALEGWYLRPADAAANGGAVLLLHGVADTRLGMLAHARYLLAAGYSVAAPDSRGHGSSGGNTIGYGVWEAEDTARWLRWLGQQAGVSRVYGVGESMGAANLIQAAALPSPVRAIVAECSFASFAEVSDYRLSHLSGIPQPLLRPLRVAGFAYARLRYGINLWQSSPAAAMAHSSVPVLLIHGTADVNIPPAQSQELKAVRRAAETELWEVPGAAHVSAIGAEPREMPRRVLGWFSSH